MEHLFEAWAKVGGEISLADHVLLLTDYDGTLTPIVELPDMAVLSDGTRAILQELAQQRRFTVGFISGRALSDLRERVGLKDTIYVGSHGLEIEGPAFSFVHPVAEEFKAVVSVLSSVLRESLSTVNGAFVEDKGITLSVHYRLVDQASIPAVASAFEQAVSAPGLLGRVKTTEGKKVYEVRPAVDWDKGQAISMVLATLQHSRPRSRLLVVSLGDDLTDEDGFKVVNELGGISILIGEEAGETAARYYLRTPAEVMEFLSRLVESEKRMA